MNRLIIRRNSVAITILLFTLLFGLVHTLKPGMMYQPDGSLRGFGINQQSKTIFPVWLVTIVLSIFSYMAILVYLDWPRYW